MGACDDPGGPVVPGTWVTSQKAVNAFEAFCLDQGWVFTETPEQTDFGKDGYLDFSKDGRLTGQCIALQIKGGVSFRRGPLCQTRLRHRSEANLLLSRARQEPPRRDYDDDRHGVGRCGA